MHEQVRLAGHHDSTSALLVVELCHLQTVRLAQIQKKAHHIQTWADSEERTHHSRLLFGDLVCHIRSYAEFGLLFGTANFCAAFLAPLRVRQPRNSMPTEKMPSRIPAHTTQYESSFVQNPRKHVPKLPHTHGMLHGLLQCFQILIFTVLSCLASSAFQRAADASGSCSHNAST